MSTFAAATPGPEAKGARVRVVALVALLLMSAAMLGLVGRVAYLQFSPPAELQRFMGERRSSVEQPGRRGDILDRRGRVLAATRFGYRVIVDPELFAKDRAKIQSRVDELARLTGVPATEFGPRLMRAIARNDKIHAGVLVEEPSPEDAAGALAASPGGEVADAPATEEAPPAAPKAPKLSRYVVVTADVLPDALVDGAKAAEIPGMHLELHPVREFADESLAASLVGVVGFDGKGALAAERVLNSRLAEKDGRFTYIRDAAMRPLWVELDGWHPPEPGHDVRLSIDLALQAVLYEELYRGVQEANAQGGRGILLDPATGEILALADIVRSPVGVVDYDWRTVIPKDKGPGGPRYRTVRADPARAQHPALAHNRCVEDVYEPGSTFKPFMWSTVTELGLAKLDEVFDTAGGHYRTPYGRNINDVVRRDSMTWAQVLVNSSNIGMTKGTARMSFAQMRAAVLKFGFGSLTGVGLPGETRGLVTSAKAWSNYTQTSVAMGHEVAVTPVQMVRAFSVFARGGPESGTMPMVTLSASTNGPASVPVVNPRVLPAHVADLTRQTMRGVTAKLDENLQREYGEGGWRYEIFGKSGTAEIPLGQPPAGKRRPLGSDGYFKGQYNSSFIAGGPVENPRLVCLIVIDDPAPELIPRKRHYGAWVAGPVVRRTLERALTYMGVPASATPSGHGEAHAGD